jgi:HSP20 family protein
MDVIEADGKFTVSVAVSGMSKEDVDVEVSPENVLTIRGRISEEHRSPENGTYYLRELRRSAFERSLSLPNHVEGDPKAVMKDGLLTLTWEVARPVVPEARRIAIEGD